MAINQLKAKYAGARLGIWWAVVSPLILALSINFVFNVVFRINIPNYTLYVLAGIIPWFFFSTTLMEVTNSFTINASVLRQGVLPRELIVVSCILANLLNFIIGLLFLLPLFIILNLKVVWFLPFLLPVIILHFIFLVGLGFILATANVFFRDMSHFLSVIFMAWFWVTPVFYSLDMLRFPFRWVCILNPMTYYVVSYQDILFTGKSPGFSTIVTMSLLTGLSYLAGHIFLVKNEKMFLKRI